MKFVAVWTEKFDSHLSTNEDLRPSVWRETLGQIVTAFSTGKGGLGQLFQLFSVNSYYTRLET